MIRYIVTALVLLLTLFGISEPAYADNCGSLSDCYGVAIAAAIAGVAIPILISLLLDFSPFGRAKGILEAILGRDVITGDKLAWWERLLNLIPGGRSASKTSKSTNAIDAFRNLIRDERGAVKLSRSPSRYNYRDIFNAERTAQGKTPLPDNWDAHHRIPQAFENHPEFKDFEFHDPSNILGVKGSRADENIHQRITNDWETFRRNFPDAEGQDIEGFAEYIDSVYEQHWFK